MRFGDQPPQPTPPSAAPPRCRRDGPAAAAWPGPDRPAGSSCFRGSANLVTRHRSSPNRVARYSGSCRSPGRTAPPAHARERRPSHRGARQPTRRSGPAPVRPKPSSQTPPTPCRFASRLAGLPAPRRTTRRCTCARTPASRPRLQPDAGPLSEPAPPRAPSPWHPDQPSGSRPPPAPTPSRDPEKLNHHGDLPVRPTLPPPAR